MNGLLALFVFIAVTIPISAQKLVTEGNVWTYTEVHSTDHYFIDGVEDFEHLVLLPKRELSLIQTFRYHFDGATEVKNKKYNRLWVTVHSKFTEYSEYISLKNTESMSEPTYYTCMREEDGKVYVDCHEYDSLVRCWRTVYQMPEEIFERTPNDEYVIYDFSKDVQDVLPNIGSIINLVFPSDETPIPSYYDGIGKLEHLNLFYRNGVLEYKSPQFYPDPFFPDEVADGIKQLYTPVTLGDTSRIYNLQGQRMAQPQTGLNIVGGRKVLVR